MATKLWSSKRDDRGSNNPVASLDNVIRLITTSEFAAKSKATLIQHLKELKRDHDATRKKRQVATEKLLKDVQAKCPDTPENAAALQQWAKMSKEYSDFYDRPDHLKQRIYELAIELARTTEDYNTRLAILNAKWTERLPEVQDEPTERLHRSASIHSLKRIPTRARRILTGRPSSEDKRDSKGKGKA